MATIGRGGGRTEAPLRLQCGLLSLRMLSRWLRVTLTEHLPGVHVCLILDRFGELITCSFQEWDAAFELVLGFLIFSDGKFVTYLRSVQGG